MTKRISISLLQKLKYLVDTCPNNLVAAYDVLTIQQKNLLRFIILEERPVASLVKGLTTKEARTVAVGVYRGAYTALRRLQEQAKIPAEIRVSPKEIARAFAKYHHTKCSMSIACYLAGAGSSTQGTQVTTRRITAYSELRYFPREVGVKYPRILAYFNALRALPRAAHYGATSIFSGAEFLTEAKPWSAKEFLSACLKVFPDGKDGGRVAPIQYTEEFVKERQEVHAVLKKHEVGHTTLDRVAACMTRAQRAAYNYFYGGVVVLPKLPKKHLAELLEIAGTIPAVVRRALEGDDHSGTPLIKSLPGCGPLLRTRSAEEAIEILRKEKRLPHNYTLKDFKKDIALHGLTFLDSYSSYEGLLRALNNKHLSSSATYYNYRESPYQKRTVRRAAQVRSLVEQKEALAALQERKIGISSMDIKKASWALSERDLALATACIVKKKKQKEVASIYGITQGAVSHRLFKACQRIRMFKDIPGMPTPEQLATVLDSVLPLWAEVTTRREEVKFSKKVHQDYFRTIAGALIKSRGNQTLASTYAGITQSHISSLLAKYMKSYRLHKGALDHTVPQELQWVWKVLIMMMEFPYIFQNIIQPHFKWKSAPTKSSRKTKVLA